MASLCFWNDFELKKPPLVTIQVEDTGFAKHVFVLINRYLQQVSTSNAQEFNQTAALIGRLIARRQNSFHNMPGFRAVCKLNTALCRLLRLDLSRDLEHFRGALPDVCDDQLSGEMPTRSSFEYILVRLLSFYYLHERIRECCLSAAKYFGQLLRNNNFMEFITVLLAAMAKINNLGKLQTNNCAQLYNKLLPQRSHFPVVEKHKFLNDEWKLPTQLQVIKLNKAASPREETTSSLAQASKVVTKVDKAKQKAKSDVGTVVSRKQPKTDIKESSFQVDSLTTVEDVKQFIVRESKARKQTPDSCITKAIQHHEWLSAKTIFESKLKTKEPAKALNIFRKFIGNKL